MLSALLSYYLHPRIWSDALPMTFSSQERMDQPTLTILSSFLSLFLPLSGMY
uniref:Uncharacterized protein n=1 Tax=Picea glauca TaxID=3330 RepID=A0A101LZZ1_PICGL|nr:hypothetical protein ABT39_MTgene4460 [Picea glauca]QHR91338.1 hypothetical protein Q903MT_gene5370 [Picea sitchensis]